MTGGTGSAGTAGRPTGGAGSSGTGYEWQGDGHIISRPAVGCGCEVASGPSGATSLFVLGALIFVRRRRRAR
jgi:MYXO-CTERM domain-containing protein